MLICLVEATFLFMIFRSQRVNKELLFGTDNDRKSNIKNLAGKKGSLLGNNGRPLKVPHSFLLSFFLPCHVPSPVEFGASKKCDPVFLRSKTS